MSVEKTPKIEKTSKPSRPLTPIYESPEKDSIWAKDGKIRDRKKVSFESILNSFVDFDNLEAKSSVKNPLALTRLKSWSKYIKDLGFEEVSDDIEYFITYFLKIMYSASGRVPKILKSLESWTVKAEGIKDMKGFGKIMESVRD